MRKNLQVLFFLLSFSSHIAMSAETYKENFVGGVFIYDGDEPYVNFSDIPGPFKLRTNNTDLIINTIANGVYDKWSAKEAISLTYCISDKFGATKESVVQALRVASEDWMNTANVKYIYMPQQDSLCNQSNKNVMFDVRPVSGQPYLARSFFPHTPRLSRNVLIDSSSFKYDEVALTGFLRHELGHTLGFRHEHISKQSQGLCPEDDSFKPLTKYDQVSVMHYPQCGGKNIITNMTISSLDEEGARLVYPFNAR